MNRKLTFLIAIMTFFAMKMSAQSDYPYGVYIGLGINNMTISNDMYYDDSEAITNMVISGYDTTYTVSYLPVLGAKVEPMASFSFGGYYEIGFSEIIGLQLHLMYNRYGYRMSGTVDQPNITDEFSVEYPYKATLKMSNIAAGVYLKFNVLAENLSVDVGVLPSYCIIMTKDVERGPLHKTMKYDSKNDYNAFNVCGSLGITWYWLDVFYTSIKANIGLVDVLKVKKPYLDPEDGTTLLYRYSDTKSRTNSVYFTVGCRF